jgi:CMP-N-acetylneuraminic acid synthetase/spore coat polysaccharide biosynthesis predicted glycosyltransferase SpsG
VNILAIIPARGGSKGIPRKNLRKMLDKPLIYYAINTAMSSKYITNVYVSSDDEEILDTAVKFGAKTHNRDKSIADDQSTLDPVIYNCCNHSQKYDNKKYDYIVTLQPTSPLLSSKSLDSAIEFILNNQYIDTIISAKNETHLSWRKESGIFIPNYTKRLNRQYLTPIFVETGGFLITKTEFVTKLNRIGNNVDLYELKNEESIDIDTYEDWSLCEYYLKRKHILFVVTGNELVGLGHVYNTLLLANDILNHKVTFLVDKDSELAFNKIKENNYPVFIQQEFDILQDIKSLNPDVVINDKLDTSKEYIQKLKKLNLKVVNFEDLGDGAEFANLVINAIYPEKEFLNNHYFGYKYFVLRDEFIYSKQKQVTKDVKNVLITFGGVDPNSYTKKVIETIYNYCQDNNIAIIVIAGFGYANYNSLNRFKNIRILKNISNISQYMLEADIIFTSAGRTTYEIASLGVPTIVLAQNERETTHFFADSSYGFLNLGLGHNISSKKLYKNFIELVESYFIRDNISNLMQKYDLKNGRKTVIKLIQNLIEE